MRFALVKTGVPERSDLTSMELVLMMHRPASREDAFYLDSLASWFDDGFFVPGFP